MEMQQDFQSIFKKHNEAFLNFNTQILMSQEFQEALRDITEKTNPENDPEAFYHAVNKLKIEYCPELADLHKDIEAVGKKYRHLV